MVSQPVSSVLSTGSTNRLGNDIPTIWFEIDDLIQYPYSQPTGIQRVCIELLTAAHEQYRHAIRFFRLDSLTGYFEPVEFSTSLADWSKRASGRLTKQDRHLRRRVPAFFGPLRGLVLGRYHQRSFERHVAPGDILVSLGAPAASSRYVASIAAAKRKFGLKFAVMIHDIIPVTHSNFFPSDIVWHFQRRLKRLVACSDLIFTPSKSSCEELRFFAGQQGWTLPPIEVIRLGATFNAQLTKAALPPVSLPERFVLCVGTIEVRKNHRLLVRIWKRLAQRHGAAAIPSLVFVGRMGWLIDNLKAELEESRFLDGKIVLITRMSDAQLAQTYQRCLFTVFPSLHEGWGLPVAESLAHGKFCVASSRASLPEVGGSFVDYFDPDDEQDALEKIERALFDEEYLRLRTAHIKAEYTAPTWSQAAQTLLVRLAGHAA